MPHGGIDDDPITIVIMIAIVVLLVIAVMMGHRYASNAVIFVGGPIVVSIARALTDGYDQGR